nr:Fanconi anemia group D2 protein [Leptinotarsa decemlineata]
MSETESDILTSQILPSLQRSQQIKNHLNDFQNKLQIFGIKLSLEDEDTHKLTQEQALVVRDLEKYFEGSKDSVEDFVKGLKQLCKKEKYFRKLLLLTRLEKNDSKEPSRYRPGRIEQESLFRIFLKVSCLQKEVMDILLTEITETSESAEDTSLLHLLLNPFRFLPHINDPQTLTTKLLDILEIASYPAQLEILDSIPDIIPDSQNSETAQQLSKLMDDKDELTGAIVDCLNVLDLDSEMRAEIQDRVLAKIASGTSLKIFPILLSFLLTDHKSQNCIQTLLKIRSALDTTMLSTDRTKERDTCKILIFNKLQAYTLSSKTITDAWLNMISSIKSHSDHKPIDFLLLFMLHTTSSAKKRIIEAIFRKRVQSGLFKISQLEKMFEKYMSHQLLKDYFTSIVEIGCSLVRASNNQMIAEFSSTLFQILFDHYYTETVYRREILDSLIVLTGSNDKKTVSTVLKIIFSLLEKKEKLQQHVILLMRLLERLDSLELKDVKMIFEILCCLTCGPDVDESVSGLGNEIHMVIRKQLYSTKKAIKHRGIVSAVVMAQNIVRTTKDYEPPLLPKDSIKSISDLPRGSAREAGSLLDLATMCTSGCAELMGLYYDQLASMLIANHHLDQAFMAWLFENITADFTFKYIGGISKTVMKESNLELELQFSLNSPEETDSPEMGINIAELTLTKNSSILLLAPHFRLLRLLHYRLQDGNLATVNALLGCAVALPKVEDIDDLESDQVKNVADCLFHCANWFREIISGFVTQHKRSLRVKVVARLEHLLEIEKKLEHCLEKVPDHKLPMSYFDSDSGIYTNKQKITKSESKSKNPKKKMKSAPVVDDPDESANTVAFSQVKKKKTLMKMLSGGQKLNFRDLDTDTVLLFKYPLKFPEDDCTQLTQTASLNIQQLEFLLKDLVSKLSIATQNKNIGLSHLNEVVPLHLIKDSAAHILPNLDSHLEVLTEKINKLLEDNDGRLDLPEMFSPDALVIKNCFGLILESFYLIFSWTGFQHSSNLEVRVSFIYCPIRIKHTDKPAEFELLSMLRIKSEVQSLTNYQHLTLWRNAALTMQGLMTIAKAQETKTNLACFLKKSIGILKLFLSHGIPIMEITLRSKPDDVVSIFKSLQLSTRFLHHLCCYTKFTKDSSLMAYVPQFRLTLESLVYRVKATLAANNCSTAFWMGNLRNRDLEGHDILSQSTTITEDNEEGSEEELPADDSDDMLEIDFSSNNDNEQRSSSEVFD